MTESRSQWVAAGSTLLALCGFPLSLLIPLFFWEYVINDKLFSLARIILQIGACFIIYIFTTYVIGILDAILSKRLTSKLAANTVTFIALVLVICAIFSIWIPEFPALPVTGMASAVLLLAYSKLTSKYFNNLIRDDSGN